MDNFYHIRKMINKDYQTFYIYGSRVYGTAHENSDVDIVAIDNNARNGEVNKGSDCSVTMMTPDHFQNLLHEHNVLALECYFVSNEFIKSEIYRHWDFELDLSKLRHSIAEKSSQSFVKAKKKFISPYEWADDERERGKKSLFHSLRILTFGIQIATDGKITDYSGANHIFEEVMTNPSKDWEDYQQRWKPEFNRLNTEFRKLAPKD